MKIALDKLNPCDLGKAYAEKVDDLWAYNPRAEFFFWYWAKAMGKEARRDPRFRVFCKVALIPFHNLFTNQSSQDIAKDINKTKLRGPAEYSAIAVFSVARAREFAVKKNPWLSAAGLSNWLCCAATALAMAANQDGVKAYNLQQMNQADILRNLFDDPFKPDTDSAP